MTRLDQHVWICDTQSSIVAFGGGKGSEAPPPPDFGPVAQADAAAAEKNFQLGQDQLNWAKDQFNTVWPYAQQYMQGQVDASQEGNANAVEAQKFYQDTYRPMETDLAGKVSSYASPENTEARAGAAMADVSNTFNAQRATAQQQLESFGIDPSQTRFGALDLATRISQAAATAAAGNQSRLATQATGLALEGEEVNIGRGYPGSVATAYKTAADSGSAGISSANQTTQTGGNTMGSPTAYESIGAGALGNWGQTLSTGYNAQLAQTQINNQLAANSASGIGSLIGGAAAIGGMALKI